MPINQRLTQPKLKIRKPPVMRGPPTKATRIRDGLNTWADERDAARKGGGEFAAFARLIAVCADDDDVLRLAELLSV